MFSRLLFVLNISGCMASRPVITEHPQDIMVHRGAPTTLNCGAFGSPTPTISWFKDGERMFTGGGDHTVLLPGGGLFFLRTRHNHRSRDSGTYSCRAENEEGVVYSKSATLTVIYLKHEFGHVPKLVTAEEGENIALSCFPPEGNPKPTISWMKEGQVLNLKSGKYSLDPSGVLLVNKLTQDDTGKYECSARNEAGTLTDSPVSLTVRISEYEEDKEEEEEEYLPSPVITDAVLLDRITGLVHWLPVLDVDDYIVRVVVGDQEITNITVEKDVNQVKLHSLDPDLVYTISIAAERQGVISSFSPEHKLSSNLREITVNLTETDNPEPELWIIGMVVVIMITLMIILAAVLIFHKISNLKEKDAEEADRTEIKRYSWMDRRWDTNQISSFKSDRLLLDNHYDYVIPNQTFESYQVSNQNTGSKLKTNQTTDSCHVIPIHSDIYHYASTPIVKTDFLMPIKLQNI